MNAPCTHSFIKQCISLVIVLSGKIYFLTTFFLFCILSYYVLMLIVIGQNPWPQSFLFFFTFVHHNSYHFVFVSHLVLGASVCQVYLHSSDFFLCRRGIGQGQQNSIRKKDHWFASLKRDVQRNIKKSKMLWAWNLIAGQNRGERKTKLLCNEATEGEKANS